MPSRKEVYNFFSSADGLEYMNPLIYLHNVYKVKLPYYSQSLLLAD